MSLWISILGAFNYIFFLYLYFLFWLQNMYIIAVFLCWAIHSWHFVIQFVIIIITYIHQCLHVFKCISMWNPLKDTRDGSSPCYTTHLFYLIIVHCNFKMVRGIKIFICYCFLFNYICHVYYHQHVTVIHTDEGLMPKTLVSLPHHGETWPLLTWLIPNFHVSPLYWLGTSVSLDVSQGPKGI